MQSPPTTVRVIGDAQMQVGPDTRALYQGRLMNWAYRAADGIPSGPYIDFGTKWVYNTALRGQNGVLSSMRVQAPITTLSPTSDRMDTFYAAFNRFNPANDMNRKIHLSKATAQYHWKNNSPVSVNMDFYVFKALQDIPADEFDEKTETLTSEYSPAEMFLRGCSGTTTTGYSNQSAANVLASLQLFPSDARKFMRKHWKLVDHRKYELMPGDEAKVNMRQPPRIIDLTENFDAFQKFPTYGLWARRGDLVTMTILRGGLGDGTTAGLTGAAGYMGLSGTNFVDLVVRKEFKVRLMPIGHTASQIVTVNELPIISSDFSQWQPAISQG